MFGTAADERRVVYSQWNEPGNRRLFTYPSTNSQKYDLWDGMGIGYIVGDTGSETAADDRANAIVTEVLLEKEGSIEVPIRAIRAARSPRRSPISWATSSMPTRW